ncbi:MAG: hypothetical protein AAFQ67_05170, partial [Pseudomonadota bacterium]
DFAGKNHIAVSSSAVEFRPHVRSNPSSPADGVQQLLEVSLQRIDGDLTSRLATNEAGVSTNAAAIATTDTALGALTTTVTANSASVVTNATAISGINGQLGAYYGITVDTGNNNDASFELISDGTALGGTIRLSADNVEIDGDVTIDGTLTTTKFAANAVTQVLDNANDSAQSVPGGVWTSVANITITTLADSRVFLHGSADHDGYTDGFSPIQWAGFRLARNTGGGAVTAIRTKSSKTVWPNQVPIIDVDQPGAGTHNYFLQVFMNVSGSINTNFTNRILVATEYKR